jgi:hypothetical protein
MQFLTAATVAAILGFAAAAPAPQSFPTGSNIIKPKTISQYEVWTGAVHFNTGSGRVFKDGKSSDITTLVSFDIPSAASGKTCEFHFYLDNASTLSGSASFDVFTSLAPATKDTTTWPSGNQRDQYAGRLKAILPGEASFVEGFPAPAKAFPCPYGQILAGELVGTGDVDRIEWYSGSAGPYLKYY